jgi:enoyl-CoA hydratase/carnithine racemase
MNQKMIRIEYHNNVAIVKLDRNVTNALNLEFVNELAETIQKVKHDSNIHSLVLSSNSLRMILRFFTKHSIKFAWIYTRYPS